MTQEIPVSNPYLSHVKKSNVRRQTIKWPPDPVPKPYLAYGNYPSYYGKRGSSDNRIKLFAKEWFQNKRVIDVGCNAGHVSIDIASHFEPLSVTGIDIDPVLIRKARNQLYKRSSLMKGSDMNYFPIIVLDHFGTLPLIKGSGEKYPHNVQFRAGNWLEEPIEETDVILALSITKWIHLNYGDDGLKRFFRKIYDSLTVGGFFILEPQSLESYHKRAKNFEMEKNLKEIKLMPNYFTDYLTKEIGFSSCQNLGTGDNDVKGFRRNIYVQENKKMEQIFKPEEDSKVNVEEESQKKHPDHSVCFVDCPPDGQADHKLAQSTVRSVTSIGFPELLTDKEVEVEHENVQNTVRSMAEYCTEFKRRNDRAVALLWEDISVTTADGAKVLLKNASGMIKSRFLAIMGPSGSGKTTLMNVLARRMAGAKMDGVSKINGIPYSNAELKTLSGYVMQDDLLNGNLTVQETLDFTAELRLPSTMTAQERKDRIDQAIHKVGLDHCRNTFIGTPTVKGVSGGERKRVCVAMELLTHPRLLFLDEPTSGLDSVTAYSLTKTLKDLAASGDCTVICTIHQPQTKIFNLFDDMMLLKAGLVVYYGPADKTVDFFAEAGFPCPPLTNPADHFLDVITPPASVSSNNVSHQHSEVDKALMRVFKPVNNKVEEEYEIYSDVFVHNPRSWGHQFSVLLRRCFLESRRSYAVVFTLFFQNLIVALLIGGAFYQIGTRASGQLRRQPVLFFAVINQGVFSALSVINSFPSERLLVLRERAAGTYQVSAYFLAKNVVDAIIQLPGPIIFSCIVYWMVGLQAEAGKFFIFVAFMTLTSMAATSTALMVSALARTTTLSVTILPMVLEVSRLFGGFFLSPANLPKYFVWLDALSYVKYAYVAVSLNEQRGLAIDCQGSPNCRDGEATISFLGLDNFTIGSCAGVLIAMIIGFRFIAYLGIRFIKW